MLEQIEGQVAENSEVFGSVIETNATGIFTKGDIERPMECVFNGSMGARGVEVGLRNGRTGNTPAQAQPWAGSGYVVRVGRGR